MARKIHKPPQKPTESPWERTTRYRLATAYEQGVLDAECALDAVGSGRTGGRLAQVGFTLGELDQGVADAIRYWTRRNATCAEYWLGWAGQLDQVHKNPQIAAETHDLPPQEVTVRSMGFCGKSGENVDLSRKTADP